MIRKLHSIVIRSLIKNENILMIKLTFFKGMAMEVRRLDVKVSPSFGALQLWPIAFK